MDNAIQINDQINDQNDERKGKTISGIFHAIIFILILLPIITYPDPPPGQQGVLVSFGVPDMGAGDDTPDTQPVEDVKPTPPSNPQTAPPTVAEKPKESKPKPVQTPKLKTQDDPNSVAIRQQEEADRKRRELAQAKQREIEEEERQEELAQQRAEAEAKAKAEADQKKLEDAKKQYGGLFGGGKGETNTPGNQGDPNGDPNSEVLSGISTGSGTIGGGLENRGGAGPPIEDKSQEQGKVVIKICVDNTGKVISAEFTQRGSTTQSPTLKKLAERNAMKYRFNSGSIDKQCGTIAYNFRVK